MNVSEAIPVYLVRLGLQSEEQLKQLAAAAIAKKKHQFELELERAFQETVASYGESSLDDFVKYGQKRVKVPVNYSKFFDEDCDAGPESEVYDGSEYDEDGEGAHERKTEDVLQRRYEEYCAMEGGFIDDEDSEVVAQDQAGNDEDSAASYQEAEESSESESEPDKDSRDSEKYSESEDAMDIYE